MSINIKCDENKIVDALLLLNKIFVDKDKLNKLDLKEVHILASSIIIKTCQSILDVLADEIKGPHLINELIIKSNLKYLNRAIH